MVIAPVILDYPHGIKLEYELKEGLILNVKWSPVALGEDAPEDLREIDITVTLTFKSGSGWNDNITTAPLPNGVDFHIMIPWGYTRIAWMGVNIGKCRLYHVSEGYVCCLDLRTYLDYKGPYLVDKKT